MSGLGRVLVVAKGVMVLIAVVAIQGCGTLPNGRGWGHGVGMCQWGAFGMSKARANYKRILEFYYPGAKIERL